MNKINFIDSNINNKKYDDDENIVVIVDTINDNINDINNNDNNRDDRLSLIPMMDLSSSSSTSSSSLSSTSISSSLSFLPLTNDNNSNDNNNNDDDDDDDSEYDDKIYKQQQQQQKNYKHWFETTTTNKIEKSHVPISKTATNNNNNNKINVNDNQMKSINNDDDDDDFIQSINKPRPQTSPSSISINKSLTNQSINLLNNDQYQNNNKDDYYYQNGKINFKSIFDLNKLSSYKQQQQHQQQQQQNIDEKILNYYYNNNNIIFINDNQNYLKNYYLKTFKMINDNDDKNNDNNNKDKTIKLNHPPINPIDYLEHYHLENNNKSDLNNNNSDDDVGNCENKQSTTIDNQNDSSSTMERGQWSGKLDFIFSCISYAVGLGNVWRFPYLCYENGGGAFLFPYLICIFIIGVPLFLMEVSLGQYFHAGGVSIWNQIPILKGVGFASMIMIGLCNTYYIIIISWTLYYLFNSLRIPLPWLNCNNEWNTNLCWITDNNNDDDSNEIPIGALSPAQEFWTRKALNITNDLSEVGQIQWHLFGTLILAWILVYLVIYKGIHQSGKIIWFMAMFPYVILTILFFYGITLPGSFDGIKFYITPQWHMLKEAKIWVAAGTQLLFTYGIGIGTNIALGSYNPTNHNFYRDSLIACLLSSFTSLFSGFVIFSVLGHMAFTMNTDVSDVARSGPGLAFIVYPEAVTRLPLPNLWAILFFVMLLVLGIDSQFCTVESFVTGIVDEWPHLLRPHRKLFTLFVVVIHFILGISMITSGGMYVFQLMDNFSASGITLIIVVLFELVAFAWIYGGKRIYENMIKMLNFEPTKLLYFIWCYISPTCLLGILIFSIVDYKAPEYAGKPFPWYGELFGFFIATISLIFIPIYFIYYLLFKTNKNQSLWNRIKNGFQPINDDNDDDDIEINKKKKNLKDINNNNNNNNKIIVINEKNNSSSMNRYII